MRDDEAQSAPIAAFRESRTSEAPWECIKLGPPDSWIEDEPYDPLTPAKEGSHSTILVLARQTHAENGKSFNASAVRLETPVAVQNQSQWNLNFDPRFQCIALHWLRVVRSDISVDKLQRDRMRLVQRETQLEHHVINGSWTLIVVLDDVRTGDIIEAGYSVENRHPINAGWCENFFFIPPQFIAGRYRTVVSFDAGRPGMAWRASPDAPARTERIVEGRTWWIWEGAQTSLREPEDNVPGYHLDYVWIQVSDVPSWNAIARRAAEQWQNAKPESDLKSLAEFAPPEVVNASAVTRIIRHIQDSFRYLSIDLITGGWVPSRPDTVIRQRFGDCKDLVWLAANILRAWGVTVRPILVGSVFREGVAKLLPMTGLFNHAILEVEIDGWARWFDLTSRCQGGDFIGQSVGRFGCGLPVDPAADGLHVQPHPSMPHQFALRETITVGTHKGEESIIEQRLSVNGYHADNLRLIRLNLGLDGFAADRLKKAERRYGKVRRYEPLQWRDDRDRNVCELVESFWIANVLANEGGKRVMFDLPPPVILQFLAIPPDKPRRNPWSVPFPLEVRHLVTVEAPGMGNRGWVRQKWTSLEFFCSWASLRPGGSWSRSIRFVLNTPEIAPKELDAYRKRLSDILKTTSQRLTLPGGRSRPRFDRPLGMLLKLGADIDACVPVENQDLFPEAVIGLAPRKHWRERIPPLLSNRRRLYFLIVIAFLLSVLITAAFR